MNKQPVMEKGQELQSKLLPETQADIAVIGMAGRFPGAQNYEEFWQNLREGRSGIQEIPRERWDWTAFWGEPKTESNKSNSKWGGFIEAVSDFDAGFFNISPREAEAMDPQQRIMLELTWACLEDAGLRPAQLAGKNVGVYIGVFNFDYKELQEKKFRIIETYHSTGTASAVIANRVSNYFDFKGPSFPIDAACASSLFAIHSALQALKMGECDLAIAGGINLLLTPTRHISFSKTGMLSPTGSCKTFDESADGYVRSEGAGVILLKPLAQALADGNCIHGILKGSAVNHNGKTHTLTYPNPDAQAAVIAEACRNAKVGPESISYVEAHGTGTPKGDPMEFQGLVKAFSTLSSEAGAALDSGYCGLGSAKTNIGHLEAAAGIAGVMKVLLAMKYRQLPGLQHFKQLNHRIASENSPFYFVQQIQDWNPPEDGTKQAFPRRAGVSSFGFGGANAHVILEEAPVIPRPADRALPYYLICLTAKTEQALRRKEQDLLHWLEGNGREHKLADISMTLLFGREHFDLRSAFLVGNEQELREKLNQVLEKGAAEGYFTASHTVKGQQIRPYFAELEKVISKKLRTTKLKNEKEYGDHLMALAEMYVAGYNPEWQMIFPENKTQRINLPTYPFARERHWIADSDAEDCNPITSRLPVSTHPLLQRNTSDLAEQRYSSIFTGREFFLAHHLVKGEKLLPGAACLEMARAAVEQAVGDLEQKQTRLRLKDVIWARTVSVGEQPLEVHIGLYPEDNGDIAFEIYGKGAGKDDEPVIYSHGKAELAPMTELPVLELKDLQARCSKNSLSSDQCYTAFTTIGLDYGPGHQGIEQAAVGQEQLLAKLALPAAIFDTKDRFLLHPSLLDAAFQATLLLNYGDLRLALPFALQELELFRPCPPAMWAFVRRSAGDKAGSRLRIADVDLCDEQGNVCVRITGFSTRVPDRATGQAAFPFEAGTLLLKPCWQEQAVAETAAASGYTQHVVILCELAGINSQSVEREMNGVRCITLQAERENIVERFQSYALQLLEEVRRILKTQASEQALVQLVVPGQGEQRLFAGLAGLLKTAQLENPKFTGQLIEAGLQDDATSLITKLLENSLSPGDNHVRYQEGRRSVAVWSEIEALAETIPWKDQGVYLITGGAGGLGLLFAQEIARKVKAATLILTGRSPLPAAKEAQLKELETLGVRLAYQQVDVTQPQAVAGLIQTIRKSFGGLHGIIHSAGVIKDNFIIKKSGAELQAVLAPKVTGLVNLDQASKAESLDFFAFFSSVAGAFGNAGQADYACANAFMDAYAEYRNTLVTLKEREGQTLSINWPLWREGGMRIDAAAEQRLTQQTGLVAMQTLTGMQALYQGFGCGERQVIVLEGNLEQIRTTFLGQPATANVRPEPPTMQEAQAGQSVDRGLLRDRAVSYFKKLLSAATKLPVQRIEADAPLETFGIDSIMILQLTDQLEKVFGPLSKTLFFEYQNIGELTGYFLEAYPDKLPELLGLEEKVQPDGSPFVMAESGEPDLRSRRRPRFASWRSVTPTEKSGALAIAVIGVSGRYPQAENIREFWKNLRDGTDCITEIPPSRWDHSLYFDEDKSRPGKTYSKWGGFLSGVDQFDPLFFHISPREAELMDPQERLFLECVYETLEDAGYTRETLSRYQSSGMQGNVGVFAGVMYEEYQLYAAQEQIQGRPLALWGNPSSIANRVSHFCNFHGPSMAVDTMCSSSLTAIHLACRSLQRGDCELAIAGGVNVSIHPNKYLFLAQGKFVSSTGRCESFGEGGDGYVPGEGVGAVLLKPLTQAVADRDHIYGVIKATAVNHGGKTNGYTVPNPNAQASVIRQAIREAELNPRVISYIEAHGTGTSLGDPIEIAGLTKTFEEYTKDKQFCALGSAKSNIGHCESAAGIAGVTKVLLQLQHGQLAPSLHAKVLNPNIDFSNTPFIVQQELAQWSRPVVKRNGEAKEYPRIAGISSFGAGGSNAHIIIAEYIPKEQPGQTITVTRQNPVVIVLSARQEEQLQAKARQLLAALQEGQFSDSSLADMAYTLQVGREAMEERLGLIVGSVKELKQKLAALADGLEGIENLYRGQVKRNKEALAVFAADEELREAVEKWIQRGKYAKLLELWVKGLAVDWNKLYRDAKPRRLSLPAYPFARKRYWAPQATAQCGKGRAAAATHSSDCQSIALSGRRINPVLSAGGKPNGIVLRSLPNEAQPPARQPQQAAAAPAAGAYNFETPLADSDRAALAVSAGYSQSAAGDIKTVSQIQTAVAAIPVEALQADLQKSLAQSLYMSREEVDVDAKFIDLGLDSIIGVEWIRAVNKRYQTSIPATKVYDYPTVCEFSGYLAKELENQNLPLPGSPAPRPVEAAVRLDLQEITRLPIGEGQTAAGGGKKPRQAAVARPGEPYGLVLSTVHSLNELALRQWRPLEPAGNEVTIRVKASAINFPDIMCVQGLYPTMPEYPFVPGFEVAGVITGRGSQVTEFDVGDEVLALTGGQMGGHAGYVNVPAVNTVHKPPNLSFAEACSMPVAFLTAYYAFAIGNLAPKEHVLIQTATGGCGLMALQLARLKGCVCYGTSSKPEKLAILRKLEVPYAINYQATEFDQEIKKITNNRGVDVVLNTLSGELIQKGLNCLASSGRYLEIAVHALKTSPRLDLSKLVRNQSIHSIDLRRLILQEDLAVKDLLKIMTAMLQTGEIVPAVSRIYSVHQLKEAFEYVAQGRHIGKVVISHEQSGMIDLTEDCIRRLLDQNQNCERRPSAVTATLPASPEKRPAQSREGIAVIGMAGQFPQAGTLNEFWQNLADGRDCISEVPATRWSLEEYYHPDVEASGKTNCKWMGVLEDADKFEPLFFNITPAEAELMDPQQRLFLQSCWHCIEDAGLSPAALSGSRCGVFAGCATNDYGQAGPGRGLNAHGLMGRSASILSARISYLLNLKGPCLAIDTACSSSLVAIAEACNSLILGTSDLALAGGVCVMVGPQMHIMTGKAGMLSPDGRCFTFDARANGFVPGEGVGVLLLKRLSDAVRDQDPIYGVIRGWGMNQDGKTNGITAPSANAQTALEKEIYERFHIDPATISLAEAHGTGTKLGDPIEVEALTAAFRAFTTEKNYCALGSVKSNIGHLLTAAGVSGAIKVLLALKHRLLPPAIHYQALNEHISLDGSPFYINSKLKPWQPPAGTERRACVSSFGFSGTNAHLVIEEYPLRSLEQPLPEVSSRQPAIIVLSARNGERLQAQARQLLTAIQNGHLAGQSLADMAYTLQVGREAMEERLGFIVNSSEELTEKLAAFIEERPGIEGLYRGQLKRNKETLAVFAADEEFQEAVVKWIQRGKYDKLLDLWAKGLVVDWHRIYADGRPRRIHLPGYLFAGERYWIADEPGNISAGLKEAAACGPEGEGGLTGALETLLFQPVWREAAIAREITAPAYQQQLAIFCEPGEAAGNSLAAGRHGIRCLILQSDQKDLAERFQTYAVRVLEELQRLLKEGRVLIQLVVPGQGERQLFAGLAGLLKTARIENPKLSGQLIEVEPEETAEKMIEILQENSQSPLAEYIRYQDGKRLLARWREIKPPAAVNPWRDGGIYLITGGTGGLGLIFAKEIARQVRGATLILTGRSPLGADKQARLNELTALGVRAEYQAVDVASRPAVSGLIERIQAKFGGLHGIIHSAGVIKDNFILKKTREELEAVLAPKVTGLVNLDLASKELPLDFIVFFSSIAGVLGNTGQADYAAANAFMDAYARYRNALAAAGQRKGPTLSINWPLWQEGGMRIDGESEQLLRQSTGLAAMATPAGIRALYQALAVGQDQVMVAAGDRLRLQACLADAFRQMPAPPAPTVPMPLEAGLLREKTVYQLKVLFGEITKLRVDRIDESEPLEAYGIDSMMITRLNRKLGGIFGELSKTLFYEYQTLAALADYLIADHRQVCVRWAGLGEQASLLPDRLAAPAAVNTGGRPPARKAIVAAPEQGVREPIAIIGLSGRYPQAKNPGEYWENLKNGKNCITEIPAERWSLDGFYHPDPQEAVTQGKSYCKWGGFIDGFADFDPLFFNMSPRETMSMDPQERLFIEACWEVLEDAGYTREELAACYHRRIGVFAGITKTGFDLYGPDLWKHDEKVFPQTSFGSVANRISYLLNLQGPSMPVDTMCSSSLTAIHEACEHLQHQACEMAIAGGVNLYLHPASYRRLCAVQMLSADGQCKSFGEGGNGFVPGEGVGCVLLKRLSRAVADGDHIYAVIRGTSVNHGGKTNGYMVPNPTAQGDVIRAALDKAGIDARTISCIEAHGTGTALGDPIEITGLTQAFRKNTPDNGFCALGSVKSNIGHLEAAAGIAGLTKIVLQMKHQKIAPSLHARNLNANIQFEQTPFAVQQELADWQRPVVEFDGQAREYPRRAGISSFGAGGVNAHVVLEEYILPEPAREPVRITAQSPALVVLSARNEERLKEQARRLLSAIRAQAGLNLANMAYTLQVGREAMEERLGLLAGSVNELEEKLQQFVAGKESIETLYRGQVKSNKAALSVLAGDKDMAKIIDAWISKGKYAKLLELWVKGLNLNWNKIYRDAKPQRMSLPAYPFAREHYWLKKTSQTSAGSSPQSNVLQGNDALYEQLIDEVINDTLSVDDAIGKIMNETDVTGG